MPSFQKILLLTATTLAAFSSAAPIAIASPARMEVAELSDTALLQRVKYPIMLTSGASARVAVDAVKAALNMRTGVPDKNDKCSAQAGNEVQHESTPHSHADSNLDLRQLSGLSSVTGLLGPVLSVLNAVHVRQLDGLPLNPVLRIAGALSGALPKLKNIVRAPLMQISNIAQRDGDSFDLAGRRLGEPSTPSLSVPGLLASARLIPSHSTSEIRAVPSLPAASAASVVPAVPSLPAPAPAPQVPECSLLLSALPLPIPISSLPITVPLPVSTSSFSVPPSIPATLKAPREDLSSEALGDFEVEVNNLIL